MARMMSSVIPCTFAEAVDQLVELCDEETLAEIRSATGDDLAFFHLSVGMAIRNAWCYPSPSPLMDEARRQMGGGVGADAVSRRLVEMLRDRLRMEA